MVTRPGARADGKKNMTKAHLATTAGLIVCLLNACTALPDKLMFNMPTGSLEPGNQQVWPRPPQIPRYLYLGDIRGESSHVQVSKNKTSTLSRFFSALVGLENESIPLISLVRPQHGVADGKGRIYVADPGRQAVFVFDETTGEFLIPGVAKGTYEMVFTPEGNYTPPETIDAVVVIGSVTDIGEIVLVPN